MRALKTLILWLLLAALPLQAAAAGVLMTCKAARFGITSGHPLPAAEPDAQLHAAHGGDCVKMVQSSSEVPDDEAPAAESACGAFCVSPPCLRTPAAEIGMRSVRSERIAYVPPYVASAIPDPPEHPPRSVSV